ncbi:uncharacterized protein LOC133867158 [Alnus glutinosa]|uniref:uncharacterized protein LOC133867158 n=1 Tax=Alnus glutinosa TaxID=3517 RepID=UPI002D7A1F1F|nr:uncharacterized protein LOC133867158 [Alnus glutinosa]
MKRVGAGFLRTLKSDTYPYQPELSRHAVVVALLSCVFFICFDIRHTLITDDNSIVMWSVHIFLFGSFFIFLQPWVQFFSQPLIGKPSYSNFNKWYVSWLLVAAVYHLPSSQSMGVYMRMNLSLFLTTFASSILCLLFFHTIFDGLRYFFSREARKWPDMWTILQLSIVSPGDAFGIISCIYTNPRTTLLSYNYFTCT